MIEIEKKWRRWCGPRSELVRATEQASDALREWTGLESAVGVQVESRGGLTETTTGVEAIDAPHEQELAHVERIIVTVRSDRDQYEVKRREALANEQEPDSYPDASVTIRVTQAGTSVTVEGEERERVQGLSIRLKETLGRATSKAPGFDRGALSLFGLMAGGVGLIFGLLISRWLGLASLANEATETAEIVGMLVGALVGGLLAWGVWWLFPPVEIFGEGEVGRSRRFRGWIYTVVGGLILAVGGAFIYELVR